LPSRRTSQRTKSSRSRTSASIRGASRLLERQESRASYIFLRGSP
jgi:hypothetical protein